MNGQPPDSYFCDKLDSDRKIFYKLIKASNESENTSDRSDRVSIDESLLDYGNNSQQTKLEDSGSRASSQFILLDFFFLS